MIQYLSLSDIGIEKIDPSTFSKLHLLKWINLENNQIKEIPHKIFSKNDKLEFICLKNNKITILHPQLFDGLKHLGKVWFEGNPIISKSWAKQDSTFIAMKGDLKQLFNNFTSKYGPVEIHEEINRLKTVSGINGTKSRNLLILFRYRNWLLFVGNTINPEMNCMKLKTLSIKFTCYRKIMENCVT